MLFDLTIAENIAYGLPPGVKCTKEDIEKAARAADCHKLVLVLLSFVE